MKKVKYRIYIKKSSGTKFTNFSCLILSEIGILVGILLYSLQTSFASSYALCKTRAYNGFLLYVFYA